MTLAEFPYKAWLTTYGAEDDAQRIADQERREKAQSYVEWQIKNDPATSALFDATYATVGGTVDLYEAMTNLAVLILEEEK